MALLTAQVGYERFLAAELRAAGLDAEPEAGRVRSTAERLPELAFLELALLDDVPIAGGSVNALARAALEVFAERLHAHRFEAPWPCLFRADRETVGLAKRAGAVRAELAAQLERRLRRTAKLLSDEPPRGEGLGLAAYFESFEAARVATRLFHNGQRRMADDDAAPSRSYLKAEEAYHVLGRAPKAGETAIDLGAAPGGWSYSAAKRGAAVLAVDNGPLKGGALDHPRIEHRREDAFHVAPEPVDWLLCDLVEDPARVLDAILGPWIEARACAAFVVNLKFGRADPLLLLERLRAPSSPLALCRVAKIRHLFHDREELTVVGELDREP